MRRDTKDSVAAFMALLGLCLAVLGFYFCPLPFWAKAGITGIGLLSFGGVLLD